MFQVPAVGQISTLVAGVEKHGFRPMSSNETSHDVESIL